MKKLTLLFLFFSTFLFAQKKWNVRFYNELVDRQYHIYADNEEETPISTKFTVTLKNMKSTLSDNEIVVIPAKTKRFLLSTLSVIVPNTANSFSYNNLFNFGDVLQEDYNEQYIYDLPFETGKSYLVFQGYNGKLSHQNQLALDFNLKEGDKIFAAREGKVVDLEEKNNTHCESANCAKFNNKILIMHPDGTFAEYVHLKQNGVEVQVGQNIEKGQFLGYSGNTGWSTGPHLHFGVFLNRLDGKRDFIETSFRTSKSEAEILKEKSTYTKNY